MTLLAGLAAWAPALLLVATLGALAARARPGRALLAVVLAQGLSLWALGRLLAPYAPARPAHALLTQLGTTFVLVALVAALRAKKAGLVRPRQVAALSFASATLAALLGAALPPLPTWLLPPLPAAEAALHALAGSGANPWMGVAQAWLTAVPLLWLAGVFGGSLALCAKAALTPWRPSFERELATRFLVSRNAETVSKVTRVATMGVALGVWLVLTAIGVLSGFEQDLLDKIVGVHAHLSIGLPGEGPIEDGAPLEAAASQGGPWSPKVLAWAPYLEGPVAVVSDINYASGDLLGIDAARSKQVLPALAALAAPAAPRPGGAAPEPGRLEVVLGSELARGLSVLPGDKVRLLIPSSETLTPLGPVPRMLTATVAATVTTSMYEADARLVVASLPVARKLLQLGPAAITGLQLRLWQPEDVGEVAAGLLPQASAAMGEGRKLQAISYAERNQTLFAALALERVVASVVLAFIILVASFSVVNTLTMAIWQRRFEVAILKAMGATSASILAVFLWQGALVGLLGTAAGTALGLGTLAALKKHGFGIPYEIYYLDSLPVHLSAIDVLATVLGSLLVLWTFALLPSQLGARLAPVEALRDG